MASFKPVQRKILPRLKGDLTPEDKYWTEFESPVIVKEYGPIQSISFSQAKPHYFAVTSSAKVQIFNPQTAESHKTLTRFKEAAYGAELRSDGKLLSVGGEEGAVRIFDVGTKSLLREFKNNKAYTSKDYVRAGDCSRLVQDLFVSGSYDHKARIFDLRTAEAILEVDHGSPIEAVLMFPSGNLFVTAGGTSLKVWDVIAGGSCLTSISNHHKTITDLCFGSDHTRILSCSMDRHVKVYDVASYSLVHSMDFPSPVLSIGLSPDDDILCVGMTDGVISIHKRKALVDIAALEEKRLLKKRFSRHLVNEQNYEPNQDAILVPEEKRAILKKHDVYLKRFEFTKALDSVLKYHIWSSMPDVTVSVLQEIDRRGGLRAALAGRSPDELTGLLGFLCRYITDPRYATVVLGITDLFWELYPFFYGQSKEVDLMINRLQEMLHLEIQTQRDLREILGTIDVLLIAAEHSSSEILRDSETTGPVIEPLGPVNSKK